MELTPDGPDCPGVTMGGELPLPGGGGNGSTTGALSGGVSMTPGMYGSRMVVMALSVEPFWYPLGSTTLNCAFAGVVVWIATPQVVAVNKIALIKVRWRSFFIGGL